MSKKMSNAPVFFAIMQARFNPILALDSYAPAIQENLRRHGFPDVQKNILNTFNLTILPEGASGQVPVSQVAQYSFLDADRTSGFLLDQGALSFQTTEYDVFETFSDNFLRGLDIVHKAVELSYTDRIGFRYLDAVFPKGGEHLPQYLNEWVLGLYEKSGGKIAHSLNETVFSVSDVSVTARTVIQDGPLGFPPDLQGHRLAVPSRFQSLNGVHAVLDNDGSIQRRESFALQTVKDRLTAIHEEIVKAFRATVTEHAMEVWA
ncbi:TIGR04255 family protein [Allomesorhizobium camelthorni]|uniref:TIGR04255 family protein n=1 Tax=Allomesorhizobium camelthorni TaxID=475069 RepID=A0A6G4WEU8_9HYPH|nr:TIGR04255 family protein [Mesorhizobium camelthorni]NGO53114.1 TIGR04255 family protein [Mesorhizobium camelthorni]